MADQVASRYDNGQPATWKEDGTGKIYTMGMVNGKSTGQKSYLSPRAIDPYSSDTGPYKSGLLGGGSEWNSETGQWDKKSNTLEKVTLAGALAPFAAMAIPAMAGGGGGSAAASAAAPLESSTIAAPSLAATVPGAGAVGTIAGAAAPLASTTIAAPSIAATIPGAGMSGTIAGGTAIPWANVLREGGQLLSNGAQQSANEDMVNNTNRSQWLRAMDDDYKTKLNAAVNVPAGLQRQALWSDFIQNAKTSDPNAARTSLLTSGQQSMVAAQKAAILKKLADANSMALPVAPETPTYQEPGKGTKLASVLGTGAQVASKIPWGKIASFF